MSLDQLHERHGSMEQQPDLPIRRSFESVVDYSTTEEPVIILDNGSGSIKAGYHTDTNPRVVLPSVVGYRTGQQTELSKLAGDSASATLYGNDALALRGVCKLSYPISRGYIDKWEEMWKMWDLILTGEEDLGYLGLSSQDMTEHPMLLTEPTLNSSKNRLKSIEYMIESFGVPKCGLAQQTVLALFGTGQVTGVVLDVGEGISQTNAIYEGYSISHASKRLNLAGRDITDRLLTLLKMNGDGSYAWASLSDWEIAKHIKETMGYVWMDELEDSVGKYEYELPDGHIIMIGDELHMATEILFDPSIIGVETGGLPALIDDTIGACDITLRRELYGNITLSGGTTKTWFLDKRLHEEINRLVPNNMKVRISQEDRDTRDQATYRGAALLASMPFFDEYCITKEEYDETGHHIITRKLHV